MTTGTEPKEVTYLPQGPKQYEPTVGIVGCGVIGGSHLRAYNQAGYDVVACCDIDEENARNRRDEYYPEADVYTDYEALISRKDIDVVDFAVHPEPRAAMMEDALKAGKHVLSEKPFVFDLDHGEELVELAADQGVKLAVNQSKRWGATLAYIRNLVEEGGIGEPMAALVTARRNKDPTPNIKQASHHWLLYEFTVHYLDFVLCLLGSNPQRVYASTTHSPIQESAIPLMAQVAIDYKNAQGTIRIDCNTHHAAEDRNYIVGSAGTVSSWPGPQGNEVRVTTDGGEFRPSLTRLRGHLGSMDEFFRAIETDEEPPHSGRNNLRTMEVTLAAIASAEEGGPKVPGEVRRVPENTIRDYLLVR